MEKNKTSALAHIQFHKRHKANSSKNKNDEDHEFNLEELFLFLVIFLLYLFTYNFAFNSLEYFEKALTREETKECIEKLDFKVYSITVSDWIESEYQVIYKPEDVVNKEDISFMFI